VIQEGNNGRDRDRTDDLYRVKVIETVYLVGSSRFLLFLSDGELPYSAEKLVAEHIRAKLSVIGFALTGKSRYRSPSTISRMR